MPGKITIKQPKLKDNILTQDVDFSANLKKYFLSKHFWVQYDASIEDNPSINNIPVLSTVLPLAWLTGSEVEVNSLDRDYLKAVTSIQRDYKYMYPKGIFQTEIYAQSVETNKNTISEPSYALSFSGGLDSTYSMINNISLKPRLVMLFGADMSLNSKDEIYKLKDNYSRFSSSNDLDINFIQTNARENLDQDKITHNYHDVLGAYFWGQLQISMFHLGMVAPLSINRFNHLIFASSVGSYETLEDQSLTPLASIPIIDEKITWAGLKVIEDGAIDRHEKIPSIKKYMESHELKMKVCLYRTSDNCGRCRKCLRTIFSLLLAEVDPNKCGFNVDALTFNRIKNMMEGKQLSEDIDHFWVQMKSDLPENPSEIVPGYSDFCEWLSLFDLEKAKKKDSIILKIYYSLPYQIARPIYKLLSG